MKSRFARGTPEYAEELRLEILALAVGVTVGLAVAIICALAPKKVIPASRAPPLCDVEICKT